MELLKDLLLVNVERENDGKKIKFTFLDEKAGEIHDVTFNKQVYNADTNKFEDSEEKSEQVEKWCTEYFGVDSNSLGSAVGVVRKDVYKYDKFNSLWESNVTNKFELSDVGMIFQAECTNVIDDGIAVRIKFEYEDKEYESKMTYSTYVESMKQWFTNPLEKQKKYDKFLEKFGIHIENKEDLIGKELMIEIRQTGKYPWAEIKPLMKKKK